MPDIDFSKYESGIDFNKVYDSERKMADALKRGAQALGVDPVDYATVISYESARTFDPWVKGPKTKWGQHRGTIQYGEPQQREHGVFPGQSFEDQVTRSNVEYLKKAGVKPGATFEEIYAAINGGNPKKSLRTPDANTGRTIADNIKLAQSHRPEVLKRFGHFFTDDTGQVRPITPATPQSAISLGAPAPTSEITQTDVDAFNARFPQQQVPNLPVPQVPAPELPDPRAMAPQIQELSQIGAASALQQKYQPFDPTQEAEYQKWLPTMEMQDTPEARQTYAQALSQVPTQVRVPGTQVVESVAQQPAPQPDLAPPTQTQDGGSVAFPREFGKPNENLEGIAGVYTPPSGLSEEQAVLSAYMAVGSRYGLTPQMVEQKIATLKASGRPLFSTGRTEGNPIAVSFGDLKDAGLTDISTDLRMEQAQSQPGLVTPKELHVGENYRQQFLDTVNQNAGQVLPYLNPLLAFLPEETKNDIGASLAGGVLGSGGRTVEALGGLTRLMANIPSVANLEELHKSMKEIGEGARGLESGLGTGGVTSTLAKVAGGAPGDIARLILLSRLPGGVIAGMAVDQGTQSAGRGETPGQIAKQTAKGAAIGALFPAARYGGAIGGAVVGGGRPIESRIADEVIGLATITGGTYAIERLSGTPEDQATQAALINALFHLTSTGLNLSGKTIRGRDEAGKTTSARVDPDGSVKLLKGEVQQPDIEMYVPAMAKTAAPPELKSAPQGRPVENPLPSETPIPMRESGLEATRIQTPDPAAVQKAQIDTRARKVTEALKGKDFVTVDELQKITRLNPTNVQDGVMTLYGAGIVELLPGNRVRLVNEGEVQKATDLFEKAKTYGQTPEVPQSSAPMVPGQNVPTTTPQGQVTGEAGRQPEVPAAPAIAVAPEIQQRNEWQSKIQTRLEEYSPEEQGKLLEGYAPVEKLNTWQLKDIYVKMDNNPPGEVGVRKSDVQRQPVKRPPAKIIEGKSLSQAVRAMGGIKTSRWDKGEGRRISNKETGSTGLINNKSGMNAEAMALRLWEAGYLRDVFETDQDVDGNVLMDLIEEDVSGLKKRYSYADYESLQQEIEKEYEAEQSAKYDEYMGKLATITKERGKLLAEIERAGYATDEQFGEIERAFTAAGLDPANARSFINDLTESTRTVREVGDVTEAGEVSPETYIFSDAAEPEGEVDTSFDPELIEQGIYTKETAKATLESESKPRPTLHGVPPQELDPVLRARVLYAKERKVTDADIAERYNLTPDQVAEVGLLPEVGQGGQMSYKLIQALVPSKTSTPEETADKIAKVNDLVSELSLPAENRVTRDTLPGEVKTAVDAIRLAIAKEMGAERASQLTPSQWLQWLDTHAEKLETETVATILDGLGHQVDHTDMKVKPFIKDPALKATLTDLDQFYGLEKIPHFDGIPNSDIKRKIKDIGYGYGLKETAIKRSFEAARRDFLAEMGEGSESGSPVRGSRENTEKVSQEQPEKRSGQTAQLSPYSTPEGRTEMATARRKAIVEEYGLDPEVDKDIIDALDKSGDILFNKQQIQTPEFKKWFGDSKVVDENGDPLVVYHGTTHDFDSFDIDRANIESHFGKAIYLTDSPADVAANYAGEGPDLTNRIEQRAERIFQEFEEDYQWGTPEYEAGMKKARREAKREIAGTSEGLTMPVYAKIENPVYIGVNGEQTYIEPGFESFDEPEPEQYDDEGEETQEWLDWDERRTEFEESQYDYESPLVQAIRKASYQYTDIDVDRIFEDIGEFTYEGGTADRLDAALRSSEGVIYAMDDEGNLASSDFIKEVFRALGYDGIIMDADQQFGSGRQMGKQMEMDYGTKHYHVFESRQLKSAIGNSGEFNPYNSNILMTRPAAGQVDLWGQPASLHATQNSLFETGSKTDTTAKELTDAYGKTGEYINTMLQSDDAGIKSVAKQIAEMRHLVAAKKAQDVVEDAADALDAYSFAQKLKTSIDNVLKQQDFEGVTFKEKLSDTGLELARAMEAGNFSKVFGQMLSDQKAQKQTETPEFKKWFRDSKVVDENGEPLVVYHGTNAPNIEGFATDKLGLSTGAQSAQQGFFFTNSPDIAHLFADDRMNPFGDRNFNDAPKGSPNIMPVYLRIERPLRTGIKELHDLASQNRIDRTKYDGVIATSAATGQQEILVFDPKQIKSAIGNRGTFDATNPNIVFSKTELRKYNRMLMEAAGKGWGHILKTGEWKAENNLVRFPNLEGLLLAQTILHKVSDPLNERPQEAGKWSGVTMGAPTATAFRFFLRQMYDAQKSQGNDVSTLEKNIVAFDSAITPQGIIGMAIDVPKLEKLSQHAAQEERSHIGDLTIAQDKAETVEVSEVYTQEPEYEQIINTIRGLGYEEKDLHKEFLGKLRTDDAAEELGVSQDVVDKFLDIRDIELLNSGVTDETYDASYARISAANRRRSERYADRYNDPARTGSVRVRTEQDKPETGGDSISDSGSRGDVRERRDPQSAPVAERKESRSERAKLRQTEVLDRAKSEALSRAERLHIESVAKNDTALQKSLANDVLYAKPRAWGKVVMHGKTYDLNPTVTKVKDVVIDIANAPKAIKASTDLSAAGRQGLITSVNHPVIAARAFAKQLTMLPPGMGAAKYDRFKRDLDIHPFIELAEEAELHLTSLGDGKMEHREEAFMSRVLGDDPYFKKQGLEKVRKALTFPVRASERAYVTFLDYIRINTFAKLAQEIHKFNLRQGIPDDIDQYKGIATWINNATGRGNLGRLDDAAPILNATFFSARYWASRLQVLNPVYYAKLPAGARKIAIREMLTFVGAVAGLMALLKLAGFEIETGDEQNPDLLKLRLGRYSYDFTAGLIGHFRYIARMIMATEEKDPAGKMSYLTQRYVRAKLAPIPSGVVSGATGKNYIGEPTSFKEEAGGLFTPIMMANFRDAAKAEGTLGAVKLVPEFFGISTTRFKTASEYKEEIRKERAKITDSSTPAERKEVGRRIEIWQNLIERSARFNALEKTR